MLNTAGKWLGFLLIAIAMIAGLYMLYFSNNKASIVSGTTLVLSPDTSSPKWPHDPEEQRALLDKCRETMLKRLAGLDFESNPRVSVRTDGRIEVFLPGEKEHKEARIRITSDAALEIYLLSDVQSQSNPSGRWRMQSPINTGEAFTFLSPEGEKIDTKSNSREFLTKVVGVPTTKPAFSSEDFLSNAKATRSNDKFAVLEVEFYLESGKRFMEFTRNNIGGILAVMYGNKLLMAPEIREVIPDGRAQITGFANIEEAKRMAEMINSGALTVGFHIESEQKPKPEE